MNTGAYRDGSLQKNNELILHSSGFTEQMNHMMRAELNEKFRLNSKDVRSKEKYWVLYIPASDAPVLRSL